MVRFAIDERSINLNGAELYDARSTFISFLSRVVEIDAGGLGICYDEELFNQDIRSGETFWQLFSPESEFRLDHEDLELAAAMFGTMMKWHEVESPQPVSCDVQVGLSPIENTGSVAWVHAQANGGLMAAACLSLPNGRNIGCNKVIVGDVDKSVWFVFSEKDIELFFRNLLSSHAEKPDDFILLAEHAFRDLRFLDNCFEGIRKMSRSCRDLSSEIVTHLSAFSDEGRRIFSGPWQAVAAEFGALGVDISDENGKTKRDKAAAAQRRLIVDGIETYFWWHSKIERHRDRIHICPDRLSEGGKIIVGIFCLHLK